ncbi:MAG TPA: cytochrome c [Candidatus Methylomirabilis sp.]|nr:cytochrome c [Candidatus Methylomirabilis sp.]
MRRHSNLRVGILLGSLLILVVAGCATMQSASKPGTGDVVADRQRLMRLNGASWADIQAKAKAGNIEAIAVNAETLALNADHTAILFPEGSLTAKSNAKPEVWQKFPEFQAASTNMGSLAAKLRDAAKAKDAASVNAMVKEFGKNACGTCHTPFRVPPKQS